MKYRKLDDYITEKLKNNPEYATEYLNAALEDYYDDFNSDALALAIKRLVLATGSIKSFSETAKVNREHLYRVFNAKATPQIDTLSKIFKNLGFQIEVKPIKAKKTRKLQTA
jgi:probable addiction module antidote protein